MMHVSRLRYPRFVASARSSIRGRRIASRFLAREKFRRAFAATDIATSMTLISVFAAAAVANNADVRASGRRRLAKLFDDGENDEKKEEGRRRDGKPRVRLLLIIRNYFCLPLRIVERRPRSRCTRYIARRINESISRAMAITRAA